MNSTNATDSTKPSIRSKNNLGVAYFIVSRITKVWLCLVLIDVCTVYSCLSLDMLDIIFNSIQFKEHCLNLHIIVLS
jgi:hypothetical protein